MTGPPARSRLREALGLTAFDLAATLACILVVAAYSNHFSGGFHFDDAHVIQQNLFIRSLANVPRFFTDATTFSSLPPNATYRPLLSLTYAIDYAVGRGLVSWSFHLTQFLIHLAVALCVFRLIVGVRRRCGPSPLDRWMALGGATLFAVHTANTETVNYLSSRSDALSTLALLFGFLLYMEWPTARRRHLHVLPMVLGALAKPPAVLLAPLLLAYALLIEEGLSFEDVARLRHPDRIRAALGRTAPAIALGVLAFLFVEAMNPDTQTYGGPARGVYLRTQAWVWLHYARLFVLPFGLTADGDFTPIAHPLDIRVLLGTGAAIALLGVAWVQSRSPSGRAVALGVVWFFVGLLPSSSVFPLAEMMNEHRVYLPFVGLTLAAAAGLGMFLSGEEPEAVADGEDAPIAASPHVTLALAAVSLVLFAHGVGTFVRNRVWRSEETLWADVTEKSPGNSRGWMNYGLTQMAAGRYERALELFRESERLSPDYPHVHTNLGIVLDALGRGPEAEPELRHAVELQPIFVEGHYYLARWLMKHGGGQEALEHARRAAELSPGYEPARELAMDLLYARGRSAELKQEASATLAVLPTHREARAYAMGAPALPSMDAPGIYNLGVARTAQSDPLGAAIAYRRSAEMAPTGDAFNNLGWSLAQLGFIDEARAAYADALRVEPTHERARNNLIGLGGRPPGS